MLNKDKYDSSHQDEFGSKPLHYVYRFNANDCNLVKLLIMEYPRSVVRCNCCSRYPLHIAWNSKASEDGIAALLVTDTSNHKMTVTEKTYTFGLLAINSACYNGASTAIIKMILDADSDGQTITTPSSFNDFPLHLAIRRTLPQVQ